MAPRQCFIWNYFKYLSPTDSTLAVCNACGETISRESEDTTKLSNSSLISHLEEKHPAVHEELERKNRLANPGTAKKTIFECDQCKFTARERYKLAEHVQEVHEKVKNFFCEQCDFASFRKNCLTRHVARVHNKERNFRCELCDYASACKGNFTAHMRMKHAEGSEIPEMLLSPEVVLQVEMDEEEGEEGLNGTPIPDPLDTPETAKHPKPKICRWVLDDGEVCGKSFARNDTLTQHKKQVHKGIRPHACHLCEKSYGRKDYLDRHIMLAHEKVNNAEMLPSRGIHKARQIKADMDGEGEDGKKTAKHAEQHFCRWVRDDGAMCEKSFTTLDSLKRHMTALHMGKRPHRCNQCGKGYGRRDYLDRHIMLTHGEANDAEISGRGRYRDRVYPRPPSPEVVLKVEMDEDGDEGLNETFEVGSISEPQVVVKAEMDEEVEDGKETAKHSKHHICRWVLDDGELCGRSFTKLDSLKKHREALHKGNRPHSCHLCSKSYGRKDYLDRHIMRVHENDNSPEKLLSPEVLLKVEMEEQGDDGLNDASEVGSMPDSDDVPIAIANSYSQKRSKRGEGTEICTWVLGNGSVCGRRFTKPDSLKQHRRQIHKGFRPHACQLCGKSYGRRDYLDRHIVLSHEKRNKVSSIPNPEIRVGNTSNLLYDPPEETICPKPKICQWVLEDGEVCGKSFSRRDNLRLHESQVHKGIRPFACHLCDMSYGRKDYLERHIMVAHEKANDAEMLTSSDVVPKDDMDEHVEDEEVPELLPSPEVVLNAE